jgi:hypothetical protein
VAGVQKRVAAASFKAPLRQVLIEAGREQGADAVVAGYLYRYRSGRETAYAVEQPARGDLRDPPDAGGGRSLLWRG